MLPMTISLLVIISYDRKKPVVAVDSNVNDSQVKAEPSAKRIKVEEPTGSNAKEKGGQSR